MIVAFLWWSLCVVGAIPVRGLYRYLDYLSAVSGGSYLAAHLASRSPNDPNALLKPRLGDKQPPRVLRFIRRGNYLDRPWEFVLDYARGLVLNLLLLGS